MGINDSELATQMWDLADGKTNSMQLAEAIDNSDLQEFGFTDEFIIELWGVITDARSGRLYWYYFLNKHYVLVYVINDDLQEDRGFLNKNHYCHHSLKSVCQL